MGPLILQSLVGSVIGAAATALLTPSNRRDSAGARSPENAPAGPQTKGTNVSIYDDEVSGDDDEVGADDIVIETAGDDDDEVGARGKRGRRRARTRARTRDGREALRRIAFLPGTAITNGTTSALPVTLNAPFKCIGMRVAGTNMNLLLFNGATIRGRPQEGSQGSVGCAAFEEGETFFWEWDTVNPGESFTLSFTNTHSASLSPLGFMIGYLAP